MLDTLRVADGDRAVGGLVGPAGQAQDAAVAVADVVVVQLKRNIFTHATFTGNRSTYLELVRQAGHLVPVVDEGEGAAGLDLARAGHQAHQDHQGEAHHAGTDGHHGSLITNSSTVKKARFSIK